MDQGASLLDLLISLLQSMVVLLLASGFYVALAVRKSDPSAERQSAAAPQGPREIV